MQSIDIKYINPFLIAAKSICGDSLKMPPVIGKPRLLEEGERLWKSFQISAVVRLSNAVQGDVLVSFSERVAIVLASQLVGEHFETVDDFCRDALGEIANLIVGTAKRSLPTGLVAISPPEIVHTRDFVFPPNRPVILLPFELSAGRFVVQIALERCEMPAATIGASAVGTAVLPEPAAQAQ